MGGNMKIGALIVAAGRGERAGNPDDGPKQYRLVGGSPVLTWTLDAFASHALIGPIAVVIHADDHAFFDKAQSRFAPSTSFITVDGGKERQQSVLLGLEALAQCNLTHVLIHDGVRPFANGELIDRVINTLSAGATGVLPALPVTDTLKRTTSDKLVEETVARAGLFSAQTPQGFAYGAIRDAHRQAAGQSLVTFTDDCSIAEWAGMAVSLVEGDQDNIKLTTARDIAMADEKLTRLNGGLNELPDVRTGSGYDVHALVDGDAVILCGHTIPHDQALSGHSDADVALHALTDALLGTCGQGDIGDHFPPSDPQWRGADSRLFLAHAVELVRSLGGTIMNADITLICEAPKIGPHRAAMRQILSDLLAIDLQRCSVKATTNEKIGFIGRGEGIAAIATATVVYQENAHD